MSAVPRPPAFLPAAVARRRPGPPRRVPRTAATALCLLGAASCNISPQPVPPPEEEHVAIAPSLISITDNPNGGVTLHGEPGAVDPGDSVLRGLNRVTPSPAVAVPVAPDGSFDLVLEGTSKDSFRVQARKDASYSAPVDLQGGGGGPVVVVEPPYGGCVTVQPDREVRFPPTQPGDIQIVPVRLSNLCPFDISVGVFGTLSSSPVFEPMLGTVSAGYVPIGAEAILAVAFHPVQDGLYEDDLVLQPIAQPPDPPPDPALLPLWILTVRGVAVTP